MDDTAYQEFFTNPSQTYHRRYEALRAVFVEGRSQKDAADEFGFTYGSLRQLVLQFRQTCGAQEESPFFETLVQAAQQRRAMTGKLPNRRLPIAGNCCSPAKSRCESEPERQACFCSCRC
jgi:transposase-like protein